MGILFKDKIVFISGSCSGLGKTTAMAFAAQGAKVIINGYNEKKVADTVAALTQLGFRVDSYVADMSFETSCEQLQQFLLSKYGGLDILIANAGLSLKDLFNKTKPEIFRKIVQNNIFSVSSAFYYLFPLLEKSKGNFVLINSVAGLQGLPTSSAYSVGKMALRAFAQSVDAEIKNSGVHLGSIYFGFIQNDAQKTTYNGDGHLVDVPKRNLSVTPQQLAAKKILECCLRRKRTMYVSMFAKMIYLLSRLSPSLLNYLMRLNLRRMMAAQKLN